MEIEKNVNEVDRVYDIASVNENILNGSVVLNDVTEIYKFVLGERHDKKLTMRVTNGTV